jgi:hypothetical protein
VLDRLVELEKAATAAPWEDYKSHLPGLSTPDGGMRLMAGCSDDDRALIALSRNHLRALIEVARAAWQFDARFEERLKDLAAPLNAALDTLLQAAAPSDELRGE